MFCRTNTNYINSEVGAPLYKIDTEATEPEEGFFEVAGVSGEEEEAAAAASTAARSHIQLWERAAASGMASTSLPQAVCCTRYLTLAARCMRLVGNGGLQSKERC